MYSIASLGLVESPPIHFGKNCTEWALLWPLHCKQTSKADCFVITISNFLTGQKYSECVVLTESYADQWRRKSIQKIAGVIRSLQNIQVCMFETPPRVLPALSCSLNFWPLNNQHRFEFCYSLNFSIIILHLQPSAATTLKGFLALPDLHRTHKLLHLLGISKHLSFFTTWSGSTAAASL